MHSLTRAQYNNYNTNSQFEISLPQTNSKYFSIRRLEKDTVKMEKLQENMLFLQNKLSNERVKLTDMLVTQTVRTTISVDCVDNRKIFEKMIKCYV